MSCYKTSNNRFFGDNPIMSDGRFFTDYRPSQDQILKNKHKPEVSTSNQPNINNLEENCDCSEGYNGLRVIPPQYNMKCGTEGCVLEKSRAYKTDKYSNVLGIGREIVNTSTPIMGKFVSPLLNETPDNGIWNVPQGKFGSLASNNIKAKPAKSRKCKPNVCTNSNKEYCIIDPDLNQYINSLRNSSDPNNKRKLMAYEAYRASPSVCDKNPNNI